MKQNRLISTLVILLILTSQALYGSDDNNRKNLENTGVGSTLMISTDTLLQETHNHTSHSHVDQTQVTASLGDFPSLHPLIVHFPIVLLVMVVVIQLSNVIFQKTTLDWVVTTFLFLGLIGAYLSTSLIHPHTHGLETKAALVLEKHDIWAYRTVYLAATCLVFQSVAQFKLNFRWMKIIVFVITLLAGVSVSVTGHYGAQLVHIEGVGPQGKFLELEESGEHSH